jgi:hypothetical protein
MKSYKLHYCDKRKEARPYPEGDMIMEASSLLDVIHRFYDLHPGFEIELITEINEPSEQ